MLVVSFVFKAQQAPQGAYFHGNTTAGRTGAGRGRQGERGSCLAPTWREPGACQGPAATPLLPPDGSLLPRAGSLSLASSGERRGGSAAGGRGCPWAASRRGGPWGEKGGSRGQPWGALCRGAEGDQKSRTEAQKHHLCIILTYSPEVIFKIPCF